MTLSLPTAADKLVIGNDAAWALAFYKEEGNRVSVDPVLTISRSQYYAGIEATLPSGLEGGSYAITIEGLTDADYAKIAQTGPGQPSLVKLYLFWRDTNLSVGGYLANLASLTDFGSGPSAAQLQPALVAVLRITKVSRRAGTRHYETNIEAQERAYRAMLGRFGAPLEAATLQEAALKIGELSGVPVSTYDLDKLPAKTAEAEGSETRTFAPGSLYGSAMLDLAKAIEESTGKAGRGMLLIRDGAIHVGPRPIPFDGQSKPLTVATGLIETQIEESVPADPNFMADDPQAEPVRQRRQVKLVLKGRPDIKPGDVVRLDLPPEDVARATPSLGDALRGAFAGSLLPSLGELSNDAVSLYVVSVSHKLSRTSGFQTDVTGLEFKGLDDAWDAPTPTGSPDGQSAGPAGMAAGIAAHAAQAVRQIARAVTGTGRFAEVGEVRRVTATGNLSAEPPGQTETVWRGLAPADGRPNQARRLPVERVNPAPALGVAYATPFAWGPCGLVLPRYPGTRVVMLHRNGQASDPIDVGAVWQSGHGPQQAQAGDWWLILPVGAASRESIADDATPQEHTGKATNDLIDADGNRVIEAGEFTIRVGRESLRNAGERPARPGTPDSITIEHADGNARIVIEKNGGITIDAGTGDITMKAANVKVQVSGTMDVS